MSSTVTINMSIGPTTWFTSFSGDLYLRYQCTFEEHDCPDQHGSNT
jgi:hypothetical protein